MLWHCRRCGCSFAVGLPYCPQCTGTDVDKGEGSMPKTTKARGATDKRVVTEPREGAPVEPGEAIDHPADGTPSPELVGDGTGTALPPIEDDEARKAAESETPAKATKATKAAKAPARKRASSGSRRTSS